MANFSNAILSLRSRSRRSRSISLGIVATVVLVMAYLFTVVAWRYSDFRGRNMITLRQLSEEEIRPRPPESILLHLSHALDRVLGPLPSQGGASSPNNPSKPISQADFDVLKQEVALLIESYKAVRESQPPLASTREVGTDWPSTISSFALSVGTIGLLVLVLQIIIAFIRYYARLAELYDAQTDALEASDGSADAAYQFIEKFSPAAIDFGRLPTPIYERAIDALAQVAKAKVDTKA